MKLLHLDEEKANMIKQRCSRIHSFRRGQTHFTAPAHRHSTFWNPILIATIIQLKPLNPHKFVWSCAMIWFRCVRGSPPGSRVWRCTRIAAAFTTQRAGIIAVSFFFNIIMIRMRAMEFTICRQTKPTITMTPPSHTRTQPRTIQHQQNEAAWHGVEAGVRCGQCVEYMSDLF